MTGACTGNPWTLTQFTKFDGLSFNKSSNNLIGTSYQENGFTFIPFADPFVYAENHASHPGSGITVRLDGVAVNFQLLPAGGLTNSVSLHISGSNQFGRLVCSDGVSSGPGGGTPVTDETGGVPVSSLGRALRRTGPRNSVRPDQRGSNILHLPS